jgi:hypothetical protein
MIGLAVKPEILLTDGHLKVVPQVQPAYIGLTVHGRRDAHSGNGSAHDDDSEREERHKGEFLLQWYAYIPEHNDRIGYD